ncbi:MAG: hypothetical protein HMLKMBBP_00986 [Planctomycetes bacterium]|nr:hypothetical protein [Planctomycetota bacterium]
MKRSDSSSGNSAGITVEDELRYALFGAIDGGTERVEAALSIGTDRSLADRLAEHRAIRDALRRPQGEAVPEHLIRWVRREVAAREVAAPDFSSWIAAVPVPMAAGMRGGAAAPLLACDAGGVRLQAQVVGPRGGDAGGVVGRVRRSEGGVLAQVRVSLIVSGLLVSSTDTDDAGTFEFAPLPEGPIGLRVEAPGGDIHVALSTGADGLAPDARV